MTVPTPCITVPPAEAALVWPNDVHAGDKLASTVIGTELLIEGDLKSTEDVLVEGTVRGRVTSEARVELSSSATVGSEVSGTTVSVAGTVSGNVSATERVDLQAGGRLTGDVRSPRLTIADGATFRGKVDMDV